MKPPALIHRTRGPNPEKSFFGPSSAIILLNVSIMPLYLNSALDDDSIILVLTTSNGVVNPAAMPPAIEPHKADS